MTLLAFPKFVLFWFQSKENSLEARKRLSFVSSQGDKESRDGINKIFNLFDDDKTGTDLFFLLFCLGLKSEKCFVSVLLFPFFHHPKDCRVARF